MEDGGAEVAALTDQLRQRVDALTTASETWQQVRSAHRDCRRSRHGQRVQRRVDTPRGQQVLSPLTPAQRVSHCRNGVTAVITSELCYSSYGAGFIV